MKQFGSTEATALANILGGCAEHTGGGVWVVYVYRKDGKRVGITNETIALYPDGEWDSEAVMAIDLRAGEEEISERPGFSTEVPLTLKVKIYDNIIEGDAEGTLGILFDGTWVSLDEGQQEYFLRPATEAYGDQGAEEVAQYLRQVLETETLRPNSSGA